MLMITACARSVAARTPSTRLSFLVYICNPFAATQPKKDLSCNELKGFMKWPLLRYLRWRRIPDVKAEVRLDTRCSEVSFSASLDFLPGCNACDNFSLISQSAAFAM
jgi:hypothetical protein